jgi:hypothetical protein
MGGGGEGTKTFEKCLPFQAILGQGGEKPAENIGERIQEKGREQRKIQRQMEQI